MSAEEFTPWSAALVIDGLRYETQSRNGYTAVDMYRDGRMVKGPIFAGSRKAAVEEVWRLRDAYLNGAADAVTYLAAVVALATALRGGLTAA